MLLAVLMGVYTIHTHAMRGQTQPSGVVVDTIALPPIDRGVMPDQSRAPDSLETRIRNSIRALDAPEIRAGASGARYVAGKVIVKFKDGASTASRLRAQSIAAAQASERPSYADFEVMRIDPAADAEAVAAALAAQPDVEYAQASHLVHTEMVPNDPLYFHQWNMPDIGMERAWDIQPQAASSITVAVVDTGIAWTNVTMRYHANAFVVNPNGDVVTGGAGTQYPSLGDLTLSFAASPDLGPSSRFVAAHDFVWTNNPNLPLDLDGHGTHVSGTIGQSTNNNLGVAGVAYNVKLMPVKVLASEWDVIFGAATDVGGSDEDVARGLRYAADNGAKVINLSLGESGPAGSAPVVEDALKYAVGKGAFVAVAGGNDFEDGNPNQVLPEIANRVRGVVSVAAVDRAHNRAYYSSSGSYIELAAPGGSFRGFPSEGGILQQTLDLSLVETFTLPLARFTAPRFDAFAYFYFIGTSQATPHVSAVAAMLMQQGITDPAAVEGALERFAIDPASRQPRHGTRDNDFGYGEIDARATLRGLGLAR